MKLRIDRIARATVLTVAGALLLVGGCRKSRGWKEEQGPVTPAWTPKPTPVHGLAPEALRSAVQARLAAPQRPAGIRPDQWVRVTGLYAAYDTLPLWLEEGGPRDRARALVSELAKAPTHGLRLGDYPLDELHRALSAVRDAGRSPSPEQLATADVLLSAAYVALAEDLLTGQVDPRTVSQGWHINPRKVDVDSALAERLKLEPLDRAIAQLRPDNPDYDSLRVQLDIYREIVAAGGWPAVPALPKAKLLKPRDTTSADRLRALAKRLRVEGYLDGEDVAAAPADSAAPNVERAVYDERLAAAVAAYQARHGIAVDSILGGETVESLNLPASYRAGQLATNLERFRWLPRTLGERYVVVNVPAFHLEAYDAGRKALDMRVVVGMEYKDRVTPVFADSMDAVVFRPYWNVTEDIAVKEILPDVWKTPGYLAKHQYEVVRGQRDDAPAADPSILSEEGIRSGKVRIRQRPGDENALGYVKFLFPNDYNIYLHDTPQRGLFEKDVRAFSHGCIRIEKPAELAQLVLGWDAGRVAAAMADSTHDNWRVKLDRKLPVYIVYLTTYMRDGQLYFGNDLYNRDDALVKELAAGAAPEAAAVKTLEELKGLVGG
ncbi:MAG TPA: L,D-transpeptidase family protein [Gemmatimonadaceae bacterium]|nr:L,D-transpeptidase family protein [Gemmatimonadaceae bacterium]